jgi:hypothetical protein
LNLIGETALLYRISLFEFFIKTIKAIIVYFSFWHKDCLDINFLSSKIRSAINARFVRINKGFNTPFYSGKMKDNHIVIYPEIIEGNPYYAKNIVRWFLNKPGALTGKIEFGKNELYFYYQRIFDDQKINPNRDNELFTINLNTEKYRNTNKGKRDGVCYAIRKGKNRISPNLLIDGIIIDDLNQDEIASVFNSCKYFISYDTQTFYSYLAVLCGCISIVVPEEGVGINEWQPIEKYRYGIAYGKENIEFANSTKHLLIERLFKMESDSIETVKSFVTKCEHFFS